MRLLLPVLLLAVIATAVSAAYAKHQSRKLFIELQALEQQRDAMNIEWGQLQLEQSTYATHGKWKVRLANVWECTFPQRNK